MSRDSKVLVITILLFAFWVCPTTTQAEGEGKLPTATAIPDSVTFVIDKLPANTPHDASIFITGDFNDWDPGHSDYRLRKLKGKYCITLATPHDSFFYKFTRGNWSSVEGRKNGRAIPNRYYERPKGGDKENVVTIRSWEDLKTPSINVYVLLILISAFQGFLLIIAVNTNQNNNRPANNVLSVLIALISMTLLLRVSTYDREVFQWQPKLLLLPEMLLFLYGPVFYLYILRLLKIPFAWDKFWYHFIPGIIYFFAYTPYWLMDKPTFIYRVIDRDVYLFFATGGVLGLLYNAFYWNRSFGLVKANEGHPNNNLMYEHCIKYVKTVLKVKAIYLLLWLLVFVVAGVGAMSGLDNRGVVEVLLDALWLLFSFTIYFLGYYAINQPEIFRIFKEVRRYEGAPTSFETLQVHKETLDKLMREEKIFMKADLTLASLAELMNINPHTLSRVINEGFNKTFFNYINDHRVEAFKQMVEVKDTVEEPALRLAFQVGFNSKTAFNRAFKKATGQTPRAYIKESKQA